MIAGLIILTNFLIGNFLVYFFLDKNSSPMESLVTHTMFSLIAFLTLVILLKFLKHKTILWQIILLPFAGVLLGFFGYL